MVSTFFGVGPPLITYKATLGIFSIFRRSWALNHKRWYLGGRFKGLGVEVAV